MFWREEDETKPEFKVPEEVYDLVFSLRDNRLSLVQGLAALFGRIADFRQISV